MLGRVRFGRLGSTYNIWGWGEDGVGMGHIDIDICELQIMHLFLAYNTYVPCTLYSVYCSVYTVHVINITVSVYPMEHPTA